MYIFSVMCLIMLYILEFDPHVENELHSQLSARSSIGRQHILHLPPSLFCNFKCMFAVVTDFSCPSQAKHTFCDKFVKFKLLVTKSATLGRRCCMKAIWVSTVTFICQPRAKMESEEKTAWFSIYVFLVCILFCIVFYSNSFTHEP